MNFTSFASTSKLVGNLAKCSACILTWFRLKLNKDQTFRYSGNTLIFGYCIYVEICLHVVCVCAVLCVVLCVVSVSACVVCVCSVSVVVGTN